MSRSSAPDVPLRPEYELVLRCARTRLQPEDTGRILVLANAELDWMLVVGTAAEQHVSPLLYWHLRDICPETVPPVFLDFLRINFAHTVRRNLFLTAQLLRILELFRSNGILAIPYKGPLLASLLYGSLAQREFGDLDFLVRHRDVAKAQELLLGEDYRVDKDWTAAQQSHPNRVPGQYLFGRDAGVSIVELHTERTLRYFPSPLDLDGLQERLAPVAVAGRPILTFSPEDLLPILCVHGSKHMWNRVQWICDVAALADRSDLVNWSLALARASQMGVERMLLLGLYLAHNLLGAPLPGEVSERIETAPGVPRLAALARNQLFREGTGLPSVYQRFVFRVRAREHLWDGLRYCFRLATRPTEEDWSSFRLPALLSPLYRVLRPPRLLRKYGAGLVRRAGPDLAPFVPTPPMVVERMLELGEVGPNDVVYDLGCGDGRIVVAAAKRWGIRCVGVDVDPLRIAEAKACARAEGVEHLVKFVQQDAKTADLSEATVVVLYLTLLGNLKLWKRLQEQLRPGARLVSRDFEMPVWLPEKIERLEIPGGDSTTLHLWRMGTPQVSAADQQPTPRGAPRTATVGR